MRKKAVYIKSTLTIFGLLLMNLFLIMHNYGVIKAQADYMGPGVPFSAKCYKEITEVPITITSDLQLQNTASINDSIQGQLILSTNKKTNPSRLQIGITYNSALLNIQGIDLNPNFCKTSQSQNVVSIDNTNGVATITVDNNVCTQLTIQSPTTNIATINFQIIKTGSALIKLQDMSGSPQSFATIGSKNLNISPTHSAYEIMITGDTAITTPSPTRTITAPNTGIVDEYATIIAIFLLGIGLVVYYLIDTNTSTIKTNFIIYKKDE